MSTIPPGWLGSILGSPAAQGRAAADKAKSQAAEAEKVGADAFAERLQNVIDEEDRDGQVYADAEGAGSQGRPFESGDDSGNAEPPEDAAAAGSAPASAALGSAGGPRAGTSLGPGGLDLQA